MNTQDGKANCVGVKFQQEAQEDAKYERRTSLRD